MSINCSLIIDSCCDLPRDVVDAEGVKVVGFSYNNESGSHIDDMYASLTAHDFYEAMRGGDEPSTSQVTLGEFLEVFKQAYEEGKPAVLLSFSSALSGSYSTACIAADQIKQEHPDFELHVVDTKLASIAEGLLIYEAIRQHQKGMTAAELADWASEALYYAHGYFMVSDLESLHRGGAHPTLGRVCRIEARCEAVARVRARWFARSRGRCARSQEGHEGARRVLRAKP